MKQFLKDYIWFWKTSFSFMQGHNRLWIGWWCFIKAIPFCILQQKWNKMTSEQRLEWYVNEDRTMEF